MPRSGWAEYLLSWFTSPDRAAAITGDLLEESRTHSVAWFWLHVIRTTLSLFVQAMLSAPIRMAALLVAGLLSLVVGLPLTALLLRGIVESRSIVQVIGWHPSFFYWWKHWLAWFLWGRLLCPFLVGFTVAYLSRGKEMTICCALAMSTEALVLGIWFWRVAVVHLYTPTSFPVWSSLSVISLCGAGILVRHRTLNRTAHT